MSSEEDTDDIRASRLGTKEYWDECYTRETTNFDDTGDVGAIWFGANVLKSVVENIRKLPGINVHSTVLDIGTGNGYTLIALAKAGFGSLLGTDYSAQAIELARKISDTRGFHNIELLIDDITHTKLNRRFQLVVDKGTLDAIALCDVEERPGKISSYWQNVRGLMDASTPNSYFVITSCNFTAAELRSFAQQYFDYHSELEYPTITFGGQKGSTNSTVIFTPSASWNSQV